MIYLDENYIKKIGVDWDRCVNIIDQTIKLLKSGDYSQPIKPYLRYKDKKNRIIAMPAYVGGNINRSGIKWIASFPDNLEKKLPRAHSVTIINEADTGKPIAIINTALISGIRTASVSGFMLKKFINQRRPTKLTIGIVGYGPIGKFHLQMVDTLVGDLVEKVYIFDIREIKPEIYKNITSEKVIVTKNWQDAYLNSDVFITCTASARPYIDLPPKKGSLILNVSLRDFTGKIFPHVRGGIIVDEWEEVCRENTDIERMHLNMGLNKKDIFDITHLVGEKNILSVLPKDQTIMFNPMGMAVFDIAIADHYCNMAKETGINLNL